MLFIHNDKSQPGKRGKKSRTRSHHDLDPALSGPAELIVPLSGRHTGIQDRDLISEPSRKSAHSLISQRDLRDQHDHLPARRYHLFDQFHIYLGLPASRNSVKKDGSCGRILPFRQDLIQRLFLRVRKDGMLFHGNSGLLRRYPVDFILPDLHQFLVKKRFQHRGGHPQFFRGFCTVQRFFLKKSPEHSCPGPAPAFFHPGSLLRRLLSADTEIQKSFFFMADLFPHRQDCLQRLCHGGTIPLLHPGRQRHKTGFCRFLAAAQPQKRFDLRRIIFRFPGQSGHIAFSLFVPISKGDGCHHPHMNLVLHFPGNEVLKTAVEFFVGYIHNYIRI